MRPEGRCTRGNKIRYSCVTPRLEIRKNLFSQRIVQGWYSLSDMTVVATLVATALNIFKSMLDKQWQAIRKVAPQAERAE